MNLITTPVPASFRDRSIYTTNNGVSFAALKTDGSIANWGLMTSAREAVNSLVNSQNPAKSLYESGHGFAAIRTDGSAVLWFNYPAPVIVVGNSSNPVISISSNVNGFAGIYKDGTAFLDSGNPTKGVIEPIVPKDGSAVMQIYASAWGYAFVTDSGKILTVPNSNWGFEHSFEYEIAGLNIARIFAGENRFFGLTSTGQVYQFSEGVASAVSLQYDAPVVNIANNNFAFAAIHSDGRVSVWGDELYGSRYGANVPENIRQEFEDGGVVSITPSVGAFAALRTDGSILCWGHSNWVYNLENDLKLVYTPTNDEKAAEEIVSSWTTFAARLKDGSVITLNGGASEPQLVPGATNVVKLVATSGTHLRTGGFAALTKNGAVITFGDADFGGDSSAVADKLQSDVIEVFANGIAFAALKKDGSVVTWGGAWGGYREEDLLPVAQQLSSGVATIANYQSTNQLYLYGTEVADKIVGGDQSDVLLGMSGNDLILGENGSDFIDGGAGNDIIVGGDGDNLLVGNSGDDLFKLSNGNNRLIGGDGIDTVDYSEAGYGIVLNLETGAVSADTTGLSANPSNGFFDALSSIEDVIGSSKSDVIVGNSASNLILSGDGDDVVDAGAGDDLIIGGDGKGNDKYYGGAGADTVKYTSATWGITVDLTRGTAASLSNPALRGNRDAANIGVDKLHDIENVIAGNFNDVLSGNQLANKIDGEDGDDRIDGKAGNDVLNGGAGNDSLTGGAGADFMLGGAGDDVYDVDSLADTVIESAGQGMDTIRTALNNYTLASDIENLTYTGRLNSTLTGNSLDNQITGGGRADTLDGGAGNDLLMGGLGNDRYRIHEVVGGNDTIQDSGGSDGLDWVDDGQDYVMDMARAGTQNRDLAITFKDISTGNLLQTTTIKGQFASSSRLGAPAIETFYGMEYNNGNLIYGGPTLKFVGGLLGNADNNIIVGLVQADRIDARGGMDVIFAGAGNDTVRGGLGDDIINGGSGSDSLFGDAGNDKLVGDAGNDQLTGGAGADEFWFRFALDSNTNLDTITDFVRGTDKICLSSQLFRELNGQINESNFLVNQSGQANDADDRLIFNSADHKLYYDADGLGGEASIAFVTLIGVESLSVSDIMIIG